MATYTREILRAMVAARPLARLTVYLPHSAERPLAATNVAYREIPGPRLLGRHQRWPARIRRQDPDAYFSPMGQLPLLDVRCPSVLTVHDLAIYRRPEWFPPGQPLSTRLVVPRSIERATALIAVSRSTARDLAQLFDAGPDRVHVVPEGVSDAFQPLPPDQLQEVKERYALPDRFILFVGTISPRKNLPTLVEAWRTMADRPRLVLAGPWGWRHEQLQREVEELGEAILHLPSVPPEDLPALYNLATCLAHPAFYEGFGLTPLEAMACGTPVVSSDRSSLPEVVGDAALLASPDDVGAWRAALEAVLYDPGVASQLRRKGILRAAEFTWSKAAERTWRVLEGVALQRP
ncbi:MAG: glycosyltransferase family 4 protein [Chloroflexi bacterium]|nr:MAG: glycosyltransferase family 4 protein [Chloroflexota bacterium]